MVQLVPVNIRNSSSGSRWYARALTYSLTGRGDTVDEAIADLRNAVARLYPGNSVELFIRSVNITFPKSLSENEFAEWMKDRAVMVI